MHQIRLVSAHPRLVAAPVALAAGVAGTLGGSWTGGVAASAAAAAALGGGYWLQVAKQQKDLMLRRNACFLPVTAALPGYAASSPSALLAPEHEVVSFWGRTRELRRLTSWLSADDAPPVLVVVGRA